MQRNHAELTVKVYSIFYYIGAALLFLFGLAVMFLAPFALSMVRAYGNVDMGIPTGIAYQLVSGLGIIFGILLILAAVLYVWIGYSLSKYKNWARLVTIILSVPQLASVPIGTIIGAYAIYAFGFDREVRSLFGVAPAFKENGRKKKR